MSVTTIGGGGGEAVGIASQLASGSWAPGGAGSFSVDFAHPGGQVAHIVSWALEYVSPLNDWLDDLTGDTEQVAAFASTWTTAAGELRTLREDVVAVRGSVLDQKGRTARALQMRLDDIAAVLADAAEWTNATAAALQLASTIVTAVHDAVVGALSELAGLIADLFGFSLNPFSKLDDLKELASRASGFIHVIGQLIDRMTQAFQQLLALIRALQPLLAAALVELRALVGELIQKAAPIIGAAAGGFGGGVAGTVLGTLLGGPLGGLLGGLGGSVGGAGIGGLLAGVLGGGASDILAKDPQVGELDPAALDGDPLNAWTDSSGVTRIGSLQDLVDQNGRTDLMGGTEQSVVDIKKVEDPEHPGQYHYVVSLPSTQDWNLLKGPMQGDWAGTFHDDPATNDLDSNVALMVMNNPELRTQYERAVLQAMHDAGVPEGSDVVFTGFSQGGIMAASLASHPTPYNTIGIVTNGSPIDRFDIPPDVRVVSFEHDGDVVPRLDAATRPDGQHGNWTTAHLPVPAGAGQPHNNPLYSSSVEQWQQSHPQEAQQLADLFGGDVVDHQVYRWNE